MRFKILKAHRRNCYGVYATKKGLWEYPWGTPTARIYTGSKRSPRQRGDTKWFEVACFSKTCPARLAIQLDDILWNAPMNSAAVRRK